MQQVKLQSLQLPIAPNVRMSLKRDPGAEAGWLGVDRARVSDLVPTCTTSLVLKGLGQVVANTCCFFFGVVVSLLCVLYCK